MGIFFSKIVGLVGCWLVVIFQNEIFQKKMVGFVGCKVVPCFFVGWLVNFRNFHHHHSEIWVTHVHPFLKILVGGDDESLLNFPLIFSETFAFGVDEK